MGILLTSGIVLLNAAAWIGIFWLNGHVFSTLQEQIGVNWVFLPEGFLLLGVLLFGWRCCLGVFLGSFVAAYWLFAPDGIWFIPIAATLTGFSPLLAIYLLRSRFPVKRDLSDMTPLKLLIYGVVFSVISAIVHQLAFLLAGFTPVQKWPHAVWAMFVGDFFGVLIVLGIASTLLRLGSTSPKRMRQRVS